MCRDHERGLVTSFCEERLQAGYPGSMYISGVPGTGKTLTLRELEKTVRQWSNAPAVVSINCMALPEPRAVRCPRFWQCSACFDRVCPSTLSIAPTHFRLSPVLQVFAHIIEGLGDHVSSARASADDDADVTAVYPEVSLLRRLMTQPQPTGAKRRRSSSDAAGGSGRRVLLVLDELDVLVTKSNAILYELFCLPMLPGSRCVLVGAANTMNLIENMLPRLKSLNCEPAIVPFPAYGVQQLSQLLRARLDRLPWKAFDSFAVELCARRVAAASGDMRRALMCACAALDVAVTKAAGRAVPSIADDDGELPVASAPAAPPTTVTIADMSDALSSIFQTPVVDLVSSLPRDRKVVLCALMQLLQKTGRQDTSLGQVHDAYVALCLSMRSMQAVSASEFWTLCSSLADDSLISCTSSGGRSRAVGGWDRKCRVTLCASGDDVLLALQRHPSFADALRATAKQTGG